MNAEQTARMSSPAVITALALLAEVRAEALVAFVAEMAREVPTCNGSTAIHSGATMLEISIASHVAHGNGIRCFTSAAADGEESPLLVACSVARVSVSVRLVAALAAVPS